MAKGIERRQRERKQRYVTVKEGEKHDAGHNLLSKKSKEPMRRMQLLCQLYRCIPAKYGIVSSLYL
jgi:hypothetical protein